MHIEFWGRILPPSPHFPMTLVERWGSRFGQELLIHCQQFKAHANRSIQCAVKEYGQPSYYSQRPIAQVITFPDAVRAEIRDLTSKSYVS
jgi:hypothetical protein